MAEGLVLLVDRREARLRLDGRSLRVDGEAAAGPERYPLGVLDLVVVHGNPWVESGVWRALAERGIPAVLLPGRGRNRPAWLGAGLAGNLANRRAQHRAADDFECTLALAQGFLDRKLAAQARLARTVGDGRDPGIIVELAARRQSLADSRDLAGLMGLEGVAGAAWFRWLAERIPAEWGFTGRNRRPPQDPVNALLSLGYTLAGAELESAAVAGGLDPALGFLHAPEPGRPALALDLLEALRPGVDACVLDLITAEQLTPAHFRTRPAEGCRLTKEGRSRFYEAWAGYRRSWPALGIGAADDGAPERATTLPAMARFLARELGQNLRAWDNRKKGDTHG